MQSKVVFGYEYTDSYGSQFTKTPVTESLKLLRYLHVLDKARISLPKKNEKIQISFPDTGKEHIRPQMNCTFVYTTVQLDNT